MTIPKLNDNIVNFLEKEKQEKIEKNLSYSRKIYKLFQ